MDWPIRLRISDRRQDVAGFSITAWTEIRLPPSCIGNFDFPAARFRERAAKSGLKNAAPLWADSMGQVKEGRLLHPGPIPHDGKPLLWSSKQYNVSFRFGVLQADKLRACEDLKHSMTNLTCTVETPIQLLSWDNIAQISAMLAAGGGDWVMFKADRKDSYKNSRSTPMIRIPLLLLSGTPPSTAGTASSLGP